VRHGTCFHRRLSTHHAGAAPHSAVAELGVVRRFCTRPVNEAQVPTAEAYRAAFLALEPRMTETRRKLLQAHYHSPHHEATMTQISEAMGWRRYSSGNAHYGKLAQLVAEQLGLPHDGCYLTTLCTFVRPEEQGDHWLITLRPQVADALKELSWI